MENARKKIECFEDLFTWQKGIELVKAIYLITEKKGLKADFGLKEQIRRAAVSIPTNIAEGFERRSRKEYLNFLNIAKGSSGEVRSLLYVAFEVGYIDETEHKHLREKAKFISSSIANQIKAITTADT
ncbi:MAG: four helix bundle protein [Pyrinomonadaceae bacterium]